MFDDVAFGPIYQGLRPAEVRERVAAALEAVHMGHMAERVSHHLSTGEKKRIAMATVLAMEPAILVLDEPTAGLDPAPGRGLIHLLPRTAAGDARRLARPAHGAGTPAQDGRHG